MKNKKFVGTVMVPAMLHMFVFIVIPIVIGLVISLTIIHSVQTINL